MNIPKEGDEEETRAQPERRQGSADRRGRDKERRNAERVVQEVLPRRDPEQADRRES